MPVDRDAPLVRHERLGGAYFLLTFDHPEVARLARAGQFVMIKAGTAAEPPLRRPFSIMAVDADAGTFTLFVKAVGPGSVALTVLPPGGLARCLGPLGRPFDAPPRDTEALLVAGGYGIAPFLLFTRELRRSEHPLRVFYGGRTAADLPLRRPFEELGVPLAAATEDGSLGVTGRVTEPLEAHLGSSPGRAALYACGPDAMLQAVARLGERRGLAVQVSLDPWMGCGLGTCLGCVVRIQCPEDARPKYRCACTEGPVFDGSAVVWAGETASATRRRAVAAQR
jgi:dihydroorotate dehydrogenase electron transfer subunit